MKFIIATVFLFAAQAQAQNYGGGGGSNTCTVGERKAWCRDLHSTPSVDREIEINGCSVSCRDQYVPVCNPGYMYGSHCDDGIEPSRCYCG